jgi:hypothetical protein
MQIEDMARERHVLEACVAEMNTKGREVERWLAANEAKSPSGSLFSHAATNYRSPSLPASDLRRGKNLGLITQHCWDRPTIILCTLTGLGLQGAQCRHHNKHSSCAPPACHC